MSMKQVKARPTYKMNKKNFFESSGTSIRWLTGGGFLINSRGTVIMIDPVISMDEKKPTVHETGFQLLVPLPIESEEVPKLDAVLYTHADLDHIGVVTPLHLVHSANVFKGTLPSVEKLKEIGVPESKIEKIIIGDSFQIGTLNIKVIQADHPWQNSDPVKHGKAWGPYDCCGFLISTPDGEILCTGDTRLLPEHLKMENIDVLLLDISDDPYHLGQENAVLLANTLLDADLIPYHYGTYDAPKKPAHNGDPEQIITSIKNAKTRYHILAPGEKYIL